MKNVRHFRAILLFQKLTNVEQSLNMSLQAHNSLLAEKHRVTSELASVKGVLHKARSALQQTHDSPDDIRAQSFWHPSTDFRKLASCQVAAPIGK